MWSWQLWQGIREKPIPFSNAFLLFIPSYVSEADLWAASSLVFNWSSSRLPVIQ
jgi:hypothetical protein